MPPIRIRLFGQLKVGDDPIEHSGLAHSKSQELFAYLLLFRSRPHHREALADLLWGRCHPQQARKYLRKSLWQLNAFLSSLKTQDDSPLLLVEPNWIQLNPAASLWLDIDAFEASVAFDQDRPARDLSPDRYRSLADAAGLYTGDLLEGCYQDWCLVERERLRELYLILLDRLMSYCEWQRLFGAGIQYGLMILQHDRSREVTHRRLIRLHFLAGDRSSALRQYDACASALKEDLGVEPDEATRQLVAHVAQQPVTNADTHPGDKLNLGPQAWEESLKRIRTLLEMQAAVQRHLPAELEALEAALRQANAPSTSVGKGYGQGT